jgi:threonine dehydrogenase-like Zn-dependent dehydrogenase
MKAVVGLRGDLTCEELPDPEPGVGEVLVRTLCCGICGTDLHTLTHLHMKSLGWPVGPGFGAALDPSLGVVFGHEFSAEVVDYGPGAKRRLRPGARVVSMPFISGPGGTGAIGLSNVYTGGYGELMRLAEPLIIEVPNGLSGEAAAMTEPFAVGVHAVARAALEEPSAVLVVGCGSVGLSVVAALRAGGHGPVAAADFSASRRAMAEKLGADIIIDPAQTSPYSAWASLGVDEAGLGDTFRDGLGAQPRRAVVFECVGVPGVLQSIIEGCPRGSQIVVVGACLEPDQIYPFTALTKQLDIRFAVAYTSGRVSTLTVRRAAHADLLSGHSRATPGYPGFFLWGQGRHSLRPRNRPRRGSLERR